IKPLILRVILRSPGWWRSTGPVRGTGQWGRWRACLQRFRGRRACWLVLQANLRWGDLELEEDEGDDSDDDGPGAKAPIFDGENRLWSVTEIQEQLRILCEAAGG